MAKNQWFVVCDSNAFSLMISEAQSWCWQPNLTICCEAYLWRGLMWSKLIIGIINYDSQSIKQIHVYKLTKWHNHHTIKLPSGSTSLFMSNVCKLAEEPFSSLPLTYYLTIGYLTVEQIKCGALENGRIMLPIDPCLIAKIFNIEKELSWPTKTSHF